MLVASLFGCEASLVLTGAVAYAARSSGKVGEVGGGAELDRGEVEGGKGEFAPLPVDGSL
jgi:hypothetical protein